MCHFWGTVLQLIKYISKWGIETSQLNGKNHSHVTANI